MQLIWVEALMVLPYYSLLFPSLYFSGHEVQQSWWYALMDGGGGGGGGDGGGDT